MPNFAQPRLQAPAGTCDSHIHIYGDPARYPFTANRRYTPAPATVADYRAVMARLGVSRVVVVQPTAYGLDNHCTLDAVDELGPCARGVVVVTPETPKSDIREWDRRGARGARFFMLPGSILTWDMLEPVAKVAADVGWHIQLQLDGRTLPDYVERLRRLPCDVVIDHNGKFLEPVTPDHPGVRTLLLLLETGRVWVKASAPYETSRSGPPTYEDVSVIARTIIAAAPERVLWATNWPHGGEAHKPDDAGLMDLLLNWTHSADVRERILVGNPCRFYRFA